MSVCLEKREKMIRKARKEDMESVVSLLLIILKDMELPFLQKHGEAKTLEALRQGYQAEGFRYYYERGIVYEDDGEVVGILFGYFDKDEAKIDEPLEKILAGLRINSQEKMFEDKEAGVNEWYLDSISVRKDQRGNGIGGQLIDSIPEMFPDVRRIGLNVDKENPEAKKLYMKKGFTTDSEKTISGHLYDHMIKELV